MSTEIGDRIKQLRSARELSLRQLAEVSDISFNQIHKWEKGTSVPNRDSVVKLAKIFNVKPTWLLFGRDIEATESDSIQESFDALKEGGKQMIRDNINYLLSLESAEKQNGEQ
jgi:transcriptional regulator with XRE-family HTH domain